MTAQDKKSLLAVSPVATMFLGGFGLNIIVPLILWLVWKEEDASLDALGKTVINAQISWFIYIAVAAASTLLLIGIILLPAVCIAWFVFGVLHAVKVYQGDDTYIPWGTITFLK